MSSRSLILALGVAGSVALCLLSGCPHHGLEQKQGRHPPPAETSASSDSSLEARQSSKDAESTECDLLSQVRPLGRVSRTPQGLVYAWSGAGFFVRFSGTGLSGVITENGNVHSVLVDGERVRSLETQPGRHEYVLVEGLPPGQHVVGLARRTEAFLGPTQVGSLRVLGGAPLPPPPPKTRLLEVIGDSITCGYGDLGTDPSCHFSPATEDHYLSYGRLLSDRLDADLSTVAWSGRGVVKNYDGEIAPLMPELYPRVLPQDAGSRWSFQRPADYVVINLGTNDFSTEPDPSLETFASEYEKLLRLVRDKNPGARIIATVGPMLMPADRARAEAAIQKAVAARVAMGDVEVAFHHLEAENQKPGCDYHPGLRTHRAMAEELWDVFRAKPSGGKVTRDQISAR